VRENPFSVDKYNVHRAAGRVSVVALPGRRIFTVAADLLQPAAVSLPEPVAEGGRPMNAELAERYRASQRELWAEVQALRAGRTRYECPSCGQVAWASAEACLICAPCGDLLVAEEGRGEERQAPAG